MRGGGLSSRNLLEPLIVVVLHLIEVTRNVPFLQLDPLHQARPSLERLLHLVVPNLLGQGEEQLVRHSAQARDDLESFTRALMKVSKRAGPPCGVEFHDGAIGVGNEMATLNVGPDFAIREMQNDFVNAPFLRRRFVKPHLPGKPPQRDGQQRRSAGKRSQLLSHDSHDLEALRLQNPRSLGQPRSRRDRVAMIYYYLHNAS